MSERSDFALQKDRAFMKRMKDYIIAEAQKEFGYAGLADSGDFALINTGEGNVTFEINAAKGYLGRMADEKATRASPPPAEPGLRDAMERLAKSYCDEAVRYRAAEIEPQIYLEEAASDIRAQIALSRTPPQNPPCPYYCEPSHVVGEKCACPCHEQRPQGDVSLE